MTGLFLAWPTFLIALLVFGFAPGALLRLIVLAFRRDDPRRRELLGELYAVPRIERPFWVIEQLEVALFEGLRGRFARGMAHGLAGDHESVAYRGPVACAAAGITYRQLDYWAKTGLVAPSAGSPDARPYSFHDILMLRTVKRLIDTGISLQQIRAAIAYLRGYSLEEVTTLTLMGDGEKVYACSKADEIVELLARGQGIFGIVLGRILHEVDSTLMGAAQRTPLWPG
jgi:DNA-binding transcriptional MerR regulator